MQRLLQELQGEPEYGSDEVLVQLIYAQRANEMIAQLQQSDQSVDIRPSANAWAANLDNLLAELHTLQDSKGQHRPHRCSWTPPTLRVKLFPELTRYHRSGPQPS